MLQAIKEAKDRLFPPVQPDMSLASLERVLRERNHEGLLVSFNCSLGGGQIIPISSSNLDVHVSNLREHLNHGDEMRVSFWSERPVMRDTELLELVPSQMSEFRLTL